MKNILREDFFDLDCKKFNIKLFIKDSKIVFLKYNYNFFL